MQATLHWRRCDYGAEGFSALRATCLCSPDFPEGLRHSLQFIITNQQDPSGLDNTSGRSTPHHTVKTGNIKR
jgi:hypothetical protein